MNRAVVSIATLVVMLVIPAAAQGQAPGFNIPNNMDTDVTGSTPAGDGQQIGGDNPMGAGNTPGGGAGYGTNPPRKACKKRGKTRICRYYRNGNLVKVCKKKPGRKKKCRRPGHNRFVAPAAQSGPPARIPRTYLNSGFSDPTIPPVGRFYYAGSTVPGKGWCSGTLIARGLVLTAAHCLYDNDDSGTKPDANPNGYYPTNQMSFVPGASIRNDGGVYAPYGEWYLATAFVTGGFANNYGGLDWGIAVLAPDTNGNYPGDYTGNFPAYGGVQFNANTRLYSVGYPASGGFRTATYAYGGWQYFCENRWDGEYSGYDNPEPTLRGGWWFVYSTCEMNGGSSGGPVFVQFNDGTWGIIAVNNRGSDVGLWGHTAWKSWFDNRIIEFYNSVVANLRPTRTARKSGSGLTDAEGAGAIPTDVVSPGL